MRRVKPFLLLAAFSVAALFVGCQGCQPEPPATERPGVAHLQFSTYHFCALDTAGAVWCAGGNAEGQLGDGTTQERSHFVAVRDLEAMSGLAVGLFDTSCAFNEAGQLYCWGSNRRGTLARERLVRSSVPVQIEALPPVQDVTLGAYHICALTKEHQVYCWGDNSTGQIGLGEETNRAATPTLIEELPPIKKVRAGNEHTCALAEDGDLYCWGSNSEGQLGLGESQVRRKTRPQFVGLAPASTTDLAVSFNHTCVVAGERRQLHCWGNNAYGQLGLDDLDPRFEPTEITEMAHVDELAAGAAQVCARIEGRVWCAGEVLRPVEVARETGEGYVFRPSQALQQTTKIWDGILAICGPVGEHALACRGIEHPALTGDLFRQPSTLQ